MQPLEDNHVRARYVTVTICNDTFVKVSPGSRRSLMVKGKKSVLTIVDLSMISHDLKATGQGPLRVSPILLYEFNCSSRWGQRLLR